ncbi:unnamed protein product [Owenia fusiformis]|uniref:Link domain-containing protein n=1 Tax=Owenia fusiformis TaxID=6347 RepID=A0A8S4N128_OWEFU|nr:unnamed protein product [Owenia fusiformis]
MMLHLVLVLIMHHNIILPTDGAGPTCNKCITKLNGILGTLKSDCTSEIAAMKTEMAKLVLEMAKLVTNMNIIGGKLDTSTTEVNENKKKLETQKVELTSAINDNGEKMGTLKAELTSAIQQNKEQLNAMKGQVMEAKSCACENKQRRSLIYYAGWSRDDGYMFTFAQAKAYCESQGHRLATPGQMDAAFELGYSECAWGWLSDGSTRYPMQMPGASGGCGPRRHVNIRLNRNPDALAGVYCSRG